MIIIRVELHSANTGQVTELARMEVCNDGTGSKNQRHYDARTLYGRSTEQLNRRTTKRATRLENWQAERLHVWNLIATLLNGMGYGVKR